MLGVGTRWSDFTTASRTIFQHPDVRFINLNVAAGRRVQARRAAARRRRAARPRGARPRRSRASTFETPANDWDAVVERAYTLGHGPLPAQSEVIGVVNRVSDPRDVVVCAAGSMPGDLHKLWRTRDPKGYHVEYGYSCMGYEIAGALGVKMAAPDREVFVMVGDGSYLMMAQEIVTAVAGGHQAQHRPGPEPRLRVDRRAVGGARLAALRHASTATAARDETLPVDLGRQRRVSLGARVLVHARRSRSSRPRCARRAQSDVTTVVQIETDPLVPAPAPRRGGTCR